MPEATDEEYRVQAVECPLIRGAYSTGDPKVIRRVEAIHPPSRCAHVKELATAEAAAISPGTARPSRPLVPQESQ